MNEQPKIGNDLYVRDHDERVLCHKCVDACGEQWQNTFAIAVAGRGFDARVSTGHGAALPDPACVFCGNPIGVGPAGALPFSTEFGMRAARAWDEPAQTRTTTVRASCGAGRDVTLQARDNEIAKVTSPHTGPAPHGNLCIKGRFGYRHVQNRD